MALFGGASLTLYSLFIPHANDYLTPSQMVSTSSSLVMVNRVGAIIGARLVAISMDIFGYWAYFILMAFIHLGLATFIGYRITIRQAIPAKAQGALILLPGTSTAIKVTLNPETECIDNSSKAKA